MVEKVIEQIIGRIEKAVEEFQKKIPGIQNRMFDELQNELQKLATKDGKILTSTENLRIIGTIKNKIARILVDKDYIDAVKKFTGAYEDISVLQNTYFSALNATFKPKKTLEVIKSISIEATLNSLLDSGISANVLEKMGNVLRNNITGGGSVAMLSNQLRDHVLTNESGLGSLERYVSQITTDALNQYSAQYQQTIAADLGLNWGRFVGSNIKTTREFCELLTQKEWVHRSELPEIIKGKIDGVSCKLGKNGLPLGMIPGTNDNNFQVNRGGYNCGHQFFYVPDSSVPKNILDNFELRKINFPFSNRIVEYKTVKRQYSDTTVKSLSENFKLSPDQVVALTGGIPVKNPATLFHEISINGDKIVSTLENNEIILSRSIFPYQKRIYNGLMEVTNTGEGLGLSAFVNQVVAARKLGFEKIDVSAAKSDRYNGYYTWARLGYSMKVPDQQRFLAVMKSAGRKEKDLLQLMQAKDGPEFWKENGFWFEGEFDLKEDSPNMKALNRYLRKKGVEKKL